MVGVRRGCAIPSAQDAAGDLLRMAYLQPPGCSACRRADHMLAGAERMHPGLRSGRFPQDEPDNVPRLEAARAQFGVLVEDRLETLVVSMGTDRLLLDGTDDAGPARILTRCADAGAGPRWGGLPLLEAEGRLRSQWIGLTLGAVAVGGPIDGVSGSNGLLRPARRGRDHMVEPGRPGVHPRQRHTARGPDAEGELLPSRRAAAPMGLRQVTAGRGRIRRVHQCHECLPAWEQAREGGHCRTIRGSRAVTWRAALRSWGRPVTAPPPAEPTAETGVCRACACAEL